MSINDVSRLWNKTRDGCICVVVHGGKLLLLKRRNLPFLENPGVWSFVMGGRGRGETYLQTALRELEEETGLSKLNVRVVGKPRKLTLFNIPKPEQRWDNMVYVFCSNTSNIKLNLENPDHRWASLNEIRRHKRYSNIFVDEAKLLKMIKSAMGKCG